MISNTDMIVPFFFWPTSFILSEITYISQKIQEKVHKYTLLV
ncbi:hypothetical protein SORDD27_00858 [Streptococcus oralis]|uniref:Uncharacterized protein n=1 Tax=Streptococcus oralis TaxID=1303 RepID=A0A139PXN9_STROR|nr:hypothetical protein SORDD27_00858 [Streptococcus oralis]